MKPNLWLAGLAGVWLAAASLARAAEEPKFFRDFAFDAALKEAAKEKKVVFIDFFTTWCGPCKLLDRTTWQDAGVAALLKEKTIPLKIDAEKESALAERFKLDGYPTLLLVRPDGTELGRMLGYMDAAKFTTEFRQALAGKTAVMRAESTVAKAGAGGGGEPLQARYELAQALAREGKPAEALKEYLWLYDDGMRKAPAFAGVRNSFLLDSIATLGQTHPPALEALRGRREEARKRFEADPNDASLVGDLAGLNRALHDERLTLDLYEKSSAGSLGRLALGRFVFDQLLAARRFAEAAEAQPLAGFLGVFEMVAPRAFQNTGVKGGDPGAESIRGYWVESAGKEIEALAGAGKLDDARKLTKRLRELDDSPATREALRRHLERAGQPKLTDP